MCTKPSGHGKRLERMFLNFDLILKKITDQKHEVVSNVHKFFIVIASYELLLARLTIGQQQPMYAYVMALLMERFIVH